MTTDPSREAFERHMLKIGETGLSTVGMGTIARMACGDYEKAGTQERWLTWQAALAHKEADAWQPINTAPRDGTTLLLRSAKGRIASGDFGQPIGWANPKCWIWPYLNQEPTHWQPLPAAPLPQGE